MRILFSLLLFACLYTTNTYAQVIWAEPVFFTADAGVTIYFDATQGTGGLTDYGETIYAHTGIITNESTSPSDWKNVFSQWGTEDPNYALTSEGNNIYSFTIDNISDFYQVDAGISVEQLAFVFRNGDGTLEGKGDGASDIFIDVFQGGLAAVLNNPTSAYQFLSVGQSVNISMDISLDANITMTDNGIVSFMDTNNELDYEYLLTDNQIHNLEITVSVNGEEIVETIVIVPTVATVVEDRPDNIVDGINYIDDETVVLSLWGEGKEVIHVVGEFNNWIPNPAYQMKKTTDGKRFWVEIGGLTPGQEYAYQYLLDGSMTIADPLCEKILDPDDDGFIPAENYPNLKEYPYEFTNGNVSILQTAQVPYEWQITDFERPDRKDLIIYELLVRDFSVDRNYQFLIDTLDYLTTLGVNAIELMPVMEFEGNESWGYNPSFMLALDKYYGTPDKFKEFIDACHERGIAVILDIVLNHQFGQSPLVQMYPLNNNPYVNAIARHDFNVGFDMNHESEATIDFTNRVVEYWITEYNIDGYRFDLSKGFTQNNTLGNTGAWGQYDAFRVQLWKDLYDFMEELSPGFYPILEHFANNDEETELANYGLMIWGNSSHDFSESAIGYSSSFNWAYYGSRGYNFPNLISYMESHDEERMMFKAQEFGNSGNNGFYDIKNLDVALERAKMATAFYYTIPGAKMIWQFGELGYDISIDNPCRVCNKPVKWEYYSEANRKSLYDFYSIMGELKKNEEVFYTDDVDLSVSGLGKRITLRHETMDVNLIGNFGVEPRTVNPKFPSVGMWYDFFTGDSLMVSDTEAEINLGRGEFRLYTSVQLENSDTSLVDAGVYVQPLSIVKESLVIAPNPAVDYTRVSFELLESGKVVLDVYDERGQHITSINKGQLGKGLQQIEINTKSFAKGTYYIQLQAGNTIADGKLSVF